MNIGRSSVSDDLAERAMSMTETVPDSLVSALLTQVGLEYVDLPWTIAGQDPILASPLPLGAAAAAVHTACGLAAAEIWRERTGRQQSVHVDMLPAAASLDSHALQRRAGIGFGSGRGPLSDFYRCADGRWLQTNGSLRHFALGTLRVLNCGPDADQLQAAIGRRDSEELEQALADARLPGAIARTSAEWTEHPQGKAVAELGPIELQRIGDGDPQPVGSGDTPLAGVRCLELARILAGPTVGVIMAQHGGEVLNASGPLLENSMRSLIDRGHGKRSCYLDLESTEQAAELRSLALGADVIIDGYRSGALERRGLGAEDLAAARPGVVHVSVRCYGDVGDWRTRAGYEQQGESVSGVAVLHGDGTRPKTMPGAPLDYLTGFLGALGAMAALIRRSREGGSYRVRVSLVQTANWLLGLRPRYEPATATGYVGLEQWMTETPTRYGVLQHLAPVARLSETPARYPRPCPPRGFDEPAWLSRP